MVDSCGFLEPEDEGAFVDWQKKDPNSSPYRENGKVCPKCHGFGGWNLTLNAYPLHGKEDTPENRHNFSHFRSSCGTCGGWGYVHTDMNCPGHEWKFEKNLGRCYNRYKCKVCGIMQDVDSSD